MKKTRHLAGWGRTTFFMMAGVCLSLWCTGVVMFWLPVTALMDMTPAQAAWRHGAGVVHGVLTWLFCVMCGRGLWPHVRVMWHKRIDKDKWVLGLLNLALLLVLTLSGLLLLYGNPDMHEGASPLHFWVGAACPVLFLAHTWRRFVPSTGLINR